MIFTVSNFDVLQGVIEAVYLERKKSVRNCPLHSFESNFNADDYP